MNDAPSQRDLQRYFIPSYCIYWREVGVELGLSNAALDIVEAENQGSFRKCSAMLAKWLSVDTNSSWKKLFCAIESPVISSVPYKGESFQFYVFIKHARMHISNYTTV